jgi:hypothetical protein
MMSNVPALMWWSPTLNTLPVALKYDQSVNLAPVVVAKGADLIAQKIKEVRARMRCDRGESTFGACLVCRRRY